MRGNDTEDGYREGVRFFNTSGPCVPERHYMLPPEGRLPEVADLIEEGRYFILHAPRQTGKTTTLNAYARDLTASQQYVALVVSCETARWMDGDDVGGVEDAILATIAARARSLGLPAEHLPPSPWPQALTGLRLKEGLSAWAARSPLPIVLFLDEIDGITGNAMVSVLTQIRAGHNERPAPYPWSIALCGLRDLRDYRVASGAAPEPRRPQSPFNIAVSMRLGNFSGDEVTALYAQHEDDTGQQFTPDATSLAFDLSQGQPLLVNALAYEVTRRMKVPLAEPVTTAHIEAAKERIIRERPVHLDYLISRIEDPRVQRVLEPLFLGDELPPGDDVYDDDLAYVRDLGLIRQDGPGGLVQVANPIYREMLVRVLTARFQRSIREDPRDYLLPDGQLDIGKLTAKFITFWKLNGKIMTLGGAYNEYAAQLVFMGFLQSIVNGGGFVDREYGVSLRRTDILIRKPYTGPDGKPAVQQYVYELKVRRPGREDPLADGLTQLDGYLGTLGLETGTLIIFDRRANAPDASQPAQEKTASGRTITIVTLPDPAGD